MVIVCLFVSSSIAGINYRVRNTKSREKNQKIFKSNRKKLIHLSLSRTDDLREEAFNAIVNDLLGVSSSFVKRNCIFTIEEMVFNFLNEVEGSDYKYAEQKFDKLIKDFLKFKRKLYVNAVKC